MDLEDIMLSEISQRKINTVCYDCMWNLKIIKQGIKLNRRLKIQKTTWGEEGH